ncbi:MAG: microviridin/marinostatin family tricyclic proteinase inhibitor [Flavobacterium sp.]
MKNTENLKKPFFANFLENQISKDEQNIVQGGATTSVLSDNAQTMKYPSDSEDSSGVTKPIYDTAQTMKYPSDSDESGTEL